MTQNDDGVGIDGFVTVTAVTAADAPKMSQSYVKIGVLGALGALENSMMQR